MLTAEKIINTLQLEKHCEGGYFFQSHRSDNNFITSENKKRSHLTSIYYLLTKESPISCFAKNKSDLIIYFHGGDSLKIIFLENNGSIREEILGFDLLAGQRPQIICKALACKAYDLMNGEYALIGEAVAPGFDYDDLHLPTYAEIKEKYAGDFERLKKYASADREVA